MANTFALPVITALAIVRAMKPSRMSKSLKDQNWASVAIDLVLVTISVLIALQLGQLAQSHADQQGLRQTLERLDEETQTNMDILDHYLSRYAGIAEADEIARAAIVACDSSDEALDQVEYAIALMVADLNPSFVFRTAEEMARQDRFLDRLSPEFRAAFNQFQAQLAEDDDQSTINFMLIWDNHVMNDPAVGADLSPDLLTTPLQLTEPMAALCQDNAFKRRYFITAALIAGLEARMSNLRASAVAFRATLAEERARQG